MLIGNVDPQTRAVREALSEYPVCWSLDPSIAHMTRPDLIVVAGWRKLIPPDVLALAPTVGFHSARLPEFPGRAPIYWTFLRDDPYIYNTMLYLDEGVDSGDVIAVEQIPTPPTMAEAQQAVAESDARLLRRYLPALLAGSAPRHPQDPAKRGPLTTKDGYTRWLASFSR